MKKGFTFLELIIVIGIISLLLPAFKNVFRMENKKDIQSKTCVNYFYWEISNFFDNAITWRGFYTGNAGDKWWKYPQEYFIKIDINNDTVKLESENYSLDKFVFTWDWEHQQWCFGVGYYVNLTWNIQNIKINKWLGWNINNPAFLMTGTNGDRILTWEILFEFVKLNKTKPIAKIFVDKRTSQISLNRCLLREEGNNCKRWSNKN